MRRDSRSGRESPRLLSFPARFSFLCWPYRDGGLAALAPLRGAKTSAAAAPAPLPGVAPQGAPILPGGQWRPGFGRESSGRPGRHPPLDGCRPARGSGGLPGRSLSLSLGRESEARTSGATGVIPERGPAQRILCPLSFDQESGDTGPGRCLTFSQTTALPMAQSKIILATQAEQKQNEA